MKKFALYLFLLSSLSGFAQEKLTIEEAVLGYYKGLYPKTYYGLQWIDSTESYIYNTGKSLEIASVNGTTKKSIGAEITSVYPQLSYFPPLSYINDKNMVFENDNTFHVYDYHNNKNKFSIELPEGAANKDFNPHKMMVAYTVGNNLFVGSKEKS